MTITQQVLKAIEESEHSVYKIHQLTGISHSTIQRWVKRETSPSAEHMETVAGVLGMEVVIRSKDGALPLESP